MTESNMSTFLCEVLVEGNRGGSRQERDADQSTDNPASAQETHDHRFLLVQVFAPFLVFYISNILILLRFPGCRWLRMPLGLPQMP